MRRTLPEPGERSLLLAQRARASAELARNMVMADEPGEIGSEGSACETYRQSIYWALCALLAQAEPAFEADEARIWDTLDESLLVEAASGEERLERLRSSLRTGSFVYFADLPAAEQQASLIELRKLSQALLVKLAQRSIALDAIYLERAWRLALLVLLALGVAMIPAAVRKVLEARAELTSKPWRASSNHAGEGCKSPAQHCAESPNFFFHTQEEASPWVEFDLGMDQKVSKVRVDNRTDCCSERADPLVIEVSTDQKHWKRVSRHEGAFTTWEAKFSPVQARYLRVRLLKQNYLHLAGVHIF
ncbi:MAG TPA: discoidin domain-containing protein [Polyangiaceae bacterium]|nr:discoidin domain-containing protein [Polyangiaceae bacterium]